MKNSSTQLLKSKSNQLGNVSPRSTYHINPVENNDFLNHDYNNLYRSTYNDMSNNVKLN